MYLHLFLNNLNIIVISLVPYESFCNMIIYTTNTRQMCFLSSVYLHICGYKIMQRFKTSRNDSCACMRPCGLSVACDSPPAVRRGPPWINWIMILSHSYVDSYYTCLNLSAKFPMLNFVCRCRRSLPNNSMKIRICFLFIFRRPLSNNVEGLICKRLTTLFLLTQKKITYQNIIIRII